MDYLLNQRLQTLEDKQFVDSKDSIISIGFMAKAKVQKSLGIDPERTLKVSSP